MKSKKIIRMISVMMMLLLALSTFSGCRGSGVSENAIVIGVFEPEISESFTASEVVKGVELANELYPDALGREIELIYSKEGSSIEDAEASAMKFVNAKCAFVIGSSSSTLSIAAGSIFKENHVPAITATSTNPLVTSGNEYYFRSCFMDKYQGTSLAKYAFETLNARKAFIIYNEDDDFGATVGDVFQTELKSLINDELEAAVAAKRAEAVANGIMIDENDPAYTEKETPNVVTVRYTDDQNDFTNTLSTIKANMPDIIFIPSALGESAELVKQIHDIGFQGHFMGTDRWNTDLVVTAFGEEASEGVIFPVLYDENVQYNDMCQQFIDAYRERYNISGRIPDAAALGFDAYMLARNSISKSGVGAGTGEDGEKLRNAMTSTKEFYGVTGCMTYRQGNDPLKSVVLHTVSSGEIVPEGTIQPSVE